MDWFKGKFTGKPYISWENLWFPVDFPLNQSIDNITQMNDKGEHVRCQWQSHQQPEDWIELGDGYTVMAPNPSYKLQVLN